MRFQYWPVCAIFVVVFSGNLAFAHEYSCKLIHQKIASDQNHGEVLSLSINENNITYESDFSGKRYCAEKDRLTSIKGLGKFIVPASKAATTEFLVDQALLDGKESGRIKAITRDEDGKYVFSSTYDCKENLRF